tara:strand:+ start:1031 stop:1522 length:492 start_codon:yes stop_codon:yes gene_type:complete
LPFKDASKRKSYQKKYHQGWYAENGDHRKQQVANRRRKLKQRFAEYKQSLECHNCGLSGKDNQWALEHHHLDPNDKVTTIAHLVTSGYAWDTIMEEVAKCIVICANCHRMEHWEEYKQKVLNGESTTYEARGSPIGQNRRKKRKRRERERVKAINKEKRDSES